MLLINKWICVWGGIFITTDLTKLTFEYKLSRVSSEIYTCTIMLSMNNDKFISSFSTYLYNFHWHIALARMHTFSMTQNRRGARSCLSSDPKKQASNFWAWSTVLTGDCCRFSVCLRLKKFPCIITLLRAFITNIF